MMHLSFNDEFYHICFFYMIINKNKHRSLTIRFINNPLFYNNTTLPNLIKNERNHDAKNTR